LKKKSSVFVEENKETAELEFILDYVYEEDFSVISKSADGFCVFLNKETRMCDIYEIRPKTCSQFSNEGSVCKKIKKCID